MSFLTTKKLYPWIYIFIYLIYIQKIGILFLSSYEKSENDLSKFGYFHMEHPMPKEIEANPWLFIGRQLNYFLETILISNLSFMHTNMVNSGLIIWYIINILIKWDFYSNSSIVDYFYLPWETWNWYS